jgi:hypothetical protein
MVPSPSISCAIEEAKRNNREKTPTWKNRGRDPKEPEIVLSRRVSVVEVRPFDAHIIHHCQGWTGDIVRAWFLHHGLQAVRLGQGALTKEVAGGIRNMENSPQFHPDSACRAVLSLCSLEDEVDGAASADGKSLELFVVDKCLEVAVLEIDIPSKRGAVFGYAKKDSQGVVRSHQ